MKKVGGQKGHKGVSLEVNREPTGIIQLLAESKKCTCGGKVHYDSSCVSKKQVIDIKLVTEIVEYQSFEGVCDKCNVKYETQFPEGINNNVQYGENLKTLVSLLTNEGMVAIGKTIELIKGLSEGGIKLSTGTVVNFNKELANKCEPIIEELKEYLIKVNVLFVDETGVRINGKLNWLHTACNEDTTVFIVDKKRGSEATDNMGILAYYVGILMHDHLKSYYKYQTMDHAECNAHIVRYLKSIIEIFKREEAQKFLEFLIKINNEKKEAQSSGKSAFTEDEIATKEKEYLEILGSWRAKYLEVISGKKNISYYNDEKCLLERLTEYRNEHLRFIKDFNVPFDNNLAERSLRMIKTKTKVSGGFRSENGGSTFATIRSVIDTIKKRNLNLVQILNNIFKGNPVTLKNNDIGC